MTDPNLPNESARTEPEFDPNRTVNPMEEVLRRTAPDKKEVAASGSSGWERDVIEKLLLANVREQRSARRWSIFMRLLTLSLIVGGIWYAMTVEKKTIVNPTSPHTALINLEGEISADGLASASNINSALQSAFEDSGTQGVVLRINSPGGSPVQAGMMNDEIRRLREEHPKVPVYVVVEEICASGGYYVAVAADKIFVDKASIVGSIGVLMDGFGFTAVMEKVGVERRLLTAGENKGFLDPFSPVSDKQKEFALSMLKQIHQQFIEVVKTGRGDRLKEQPDTFSGLFWSGQQSVAMGLADDFGTVDSVARDVIKAEEIVDYTPQENLAERVAKRFGASFGQGAVKALLSSGKFLLK